MGNLKTVAGLIIFALIVMLGSGWYLSNNLNKKLEKINEQQIQNQMQTEERAKFFRYDLEQLNNYIENNKELAEIIRDNKIKVNRIQSIQQQQLTYIDTVPFRANLQPILAAINDNRDITLPYKDSSACNPVEGTIKYINKQLSFDINKKTFNDATIAVAYMERREWQLLWFKTRLFGKLEGNAVISSKCGISETVNIIRADD